MVDGKQVDDYWAASKKIWLVGLYVDKGVKVQFRRRTSAEPNQIQRIKFMWSTASESTRKGWFNLDRLNQLIPPGSAEKNGCRPALIQTPYFNWTEPNAYIILMFLFFTQEHAHSSVLQEENGGLAGQTARWWHLSFAFRHDQIYLLEM